MQRVQGMIFESQGKYADALLLYETLLKENVSDVFTRKRKVCVYKAQNNFTKMIEEINQILNYFPSDLGSWLELGELYLLMNDYEGAKHCYEEIILIDPRNAHFHCRLAEIFYSMGKRIEITFSILLRLTVFLQAEWKRSCLRENILLFR